MNLGSKIGLILCAIALCGFSFLAGKIQASNKLKSSEADLIQREMKLESDRVKFANDLDRFEIMLGESSKQVDRVIDQLER